MWKFLLAFASFSTLTLGQNETFKFFWPNAGNYTQPDVAIQSANASVTVFHVACPTSSAGVECNWRQALDYTIFNQSTYEATMSGDDYIVTRTCEDRGQKGVNCYAEGRDDKISSPVLVNEAWAAEPANTVTARVTSGHEKLEPTATPSRGSAASLGNVPTTGSTASSPAATGAANKHALAYAPGLMAVCVGAAALYA